MVSWIIYIDIGISCMPARRRRYVAQLRRSSQADASDARGRLGRYI